MFKKYTFFIIIFSVLSCFKDENETTMTVIKNDPRYIIESSQMVIEVADENDKAIVGLTAAFNGDIKVVNKSSFFHFEGKKINKFEELLRLTDQNGYQYDYLLHTQANEVNYTKINVFINKQVTSFASNTDFNLPISPKINVNLPKDNYQVNVNQSFTGQVDANYNHYDISKPSHVRALPGGKLGVKDNQFWLLVMEDAFEFNLFSNEKQKLNFKNPIVIQLSDVKNGSALFHYDADSHVWSYQEDVVSNQRVLTNRPGTYCIAQIKEFSVVNGTWIVNQTPNRQSTVQLTSSAGTEQVLTSNNGRWEAIVPLGENVTVTYASMCAPPENINLVVTSRNFEAETHFTTSSSLVPYRISGQIKDCNDSFVEEGFLKIKTENIDKTLYIDSSYFDFRVPLCDGDIVSLHVSSTSADQQTTTLEQVPLNLDLASLYLCEDIKDNYLVLNVDGFIKKYINLDKNVNNQVIEIGTLSFSTPIFIKFLHNNAVGNLDTQKANIVWNDDQIGGYGIELNCPSSNNCGFTKVEITYWGQNGNLVKGRFEGRFWLKTLNPLGAEYKYISGEFQIKN